MQKHLNNESIFYNPAHKTKYRISMLWIVPSTSPLILTSHKSPLYNPANNILSWYEEAIIPTIYPIIPLLQLHHHYIPFYTHYILIIPSLFISSLYPHYIKIMYALYLSIRMIIPFIPYLIASCWFRPFAAQELATPEGRRRWATGAVPPNTAAVAEATQQRPFEEYVAWQRWEPWKSMEIWDNKLMELIFSLLFYGFYMVQGIRNRGLSVCSGIFPVLKERP